MKLCNIYLSRQAKMVTMSTSSSLDTDLMSVEEKLARSLMEHLDFGPSGVEYVYNPIDHARDLHADFLAKYYSGGGESPRPIMFLGMNPGPWGMAQTGRASWRPQFSLKNRLGTTLTLKKVFTQRHIMTT